MMNHGLVLISPVILVRLLPVAEFGRYREFLLYVGLLASVAAFGINSSLLRFVPEDVKTGGWRFVNQAVLMTFVSSTIVAGGVVILNELFDQKLVGEYAIPVALYVLFYVNLDFWEPLLLAEKRSFAVLRYTTGRLVARIVVVTTSAALTRDVETIIISLISLEAVRLVISAIVWRMRAQPTQTDEPSRWKEQVQYTVPFGAALTLTTINKSLGALFVAKMLGPVALAHYTIGTYLQPVIGVIRNSLSDVVLPEMVSRNQESQADPLRLWRRTTVVTAILLIAAGVLLARFAEVIVVTIFSEAYRAAVPIFQLYLLVFLREALDFGVPLRAINRTVAVMHSNLIALFVNVALMFLLTPTWGTLGAVTALVLSRFIEGAYLGTRAASAYGISIRQLAPWVDLSKVVLAAAVSALVLYGRFWTDYFGLFGVVLGAIAYMIVLVLLLAALRLPEAGLLLQRIRTAPALVLRRH